MKKRLIAVALVLVMVITLCACKGNTPKEPEPTTDPDGPTGEPIYGGELVVGIQADLDASLDPHVSSSSAGTREVLFNVFEGLVKPDSDGNLIPAIAASYDVNDQADEYTFTLREGVLFHNGNAVTVGDVVYSLSRAAGLDTGTPLVSDVAGIASVEAKDDKTVVIKLSAPDTEFLSHITTAIIPEGIDPNTEIVGTGPYKLASRTIQESVVFEKFDGYWGTPAYIDKVTLKLIDNSETLVMSLKSGAVDMATHLISSQVAELDNMNVLEGSSNAVQALYLNNAVVPFDNVKVRQALCYAIDKQAILDLAFDGHGSLLGSSMFPAFGKYFMDELTNYYEYNPEKAKELLKEAGLENGFGFTITVPSNMQQHVDTAQVIVQQLELVGVKAKINQVEWTTWLEETYRGRNFEGTIVSFDAHGVAASDLLARFQSTNGKNMINFNSEAYDAKYKEATSTTDDAAQTAAFKECERILTEEAANVYIQDVASFVALGKSFGGFEFYPLYVCDFSTIYKVAE
ncbi:MAG: ABC transporter substrate-binding protein [Firmicutes bacterium]|nr:ABC transporter substrate-binding protein [Bacillota bacterium]